MKTIIGVIGYKNSGKDVFADIGLKLCENSTKIRFASKLKQAVSLLFDWNLEKLEDQSFKETIDPTYGVSPRQVLEWLGTTIFRQEFPNRFEKAKEIIKDNFWVITTLQTIQKTNRDLIIVPDVRFQNEVDALARLGAYLVKIERDSVKPFIDASTPDSEKIDLLVFPSHRFHVIKNNGSLQDYIDACYQFYQDVVFNNNQKES